MPGFPKWRVDMATNDIHGFCKKQKAFAWAKYYESSRKRLEADHKHYNELKALEGAGSIPVHIKEALATMGAELKKVWECPVCRYNRTDCSGDYQLRTFLL